MNFLRRLSAALFVSRLSINSISKNAARGDPRGALLFAVIYR